MLSLSASLIGQNSSNSGTGLTIVLFGWPSTTAAGRMWGEFQGLPMAAGAQVYLAGFTANF